METTYTRRQLEVHLARAAFQDRTVWLLTAIRAKDTHQSMTHAKNYQEAIREARSRYRTTHRGGVFHSHNAVEIACPVKIIEAEKAAESTSAVVNRP